MFTMNQTIVYSIENNGEAKLTCYVRQNIPYTHMAWVRLPNEFRIIEKDYKELAFTNDELVISCKNRNQFHPTNYHLATV